jgi:triacylglycerol lipase
MLARLQQLITIGLLSAAIAWAVHFVRLGDVAWAAGGALIIVFGYALFLAAEFIVLWFVNRDDPAPRASTAQHITAWWGEVLSAPRVFCWQQPFRTNTVPDFLPQGTRRRGVVLVHGFVCNRAFWNPQMRRLRALDIPFVSVTLEPVFGSIDHYADIIDGAVTRLQQATGLAPVVVAHSMGGLAARAWMDAHRGDGRAERVITIGSPHRGTFLGQWAVSPNARQMRLSSEWQQRLASREPAHRLQRFTCFYGNCDNIVFPASTATLPGADNRHLGGVAHVHMASHEDVFNEVLRWVGSPSTDAKDRDPPGTTLAR